MLTILVPIITSCSTGKLGLGNTKKLWVRLFE